ncbi:MAG: helix-turn-helix domain-containing protein [Candidatus Sedimenticola sp. (ex Thyasira tokunagai)]
MVPVMTVERFAELSGVSEDTVRGWIRKDCLPTVKIGKRRMVNIVALNRAALEEVSV